MYVDHVELWMAGTKEKKKKVTHVVFYVDAIDDKVEHVGKNRTK